MVMHSDIFLLSRMKLWWLLLPLIWSSHPTEGGTFLDVVAVLSRLMATPHHMNANPWDTKLKFLYLGTYWFYFILATSTFCLYLFHTSLHINQISISTSIPRYRLDVQVKDADDSARFIFWDNTCIELLGVTAGELQKNMLKVIFIVFYASQIYMSCITLLKLFINLIVFSNVVKHRMVLMIL
jgi:hypothetical protein